MTVPTSRAHHKQFIVGPRPMLLGSQWSAISLTGGRWLSHCDELRLTTVTGADSTPWTLLGLASQTMPDQPDPVVALATATISGVQQTYESWAGRWTLLGNDEVHLDASAQLPCHWVIDGDGDIWASSSPAAIASIVPNRPNNRRDIEYERGLSWVVPPLGTVDGARRLLPSEVLNLANGTTRWRRLAVPIHELSLGSDEDAAMRGLLDALGHGVRRLPEDEPIHLALTAGGDSRLILAATLAAGVDVNLITRRSARMSVADRLVPPKIAAAISLDHREIHPRRSSPHRVALADRHTAGHVSSGDALPFVQAVRDSFDGIEIGGHGLGIGKVKNREFPAEIGDVEMLADSIADHFGEPTDSTNRKSLACWLAMVVQHQNSQPVGEAVDWRDRFYLEQRTAGWQAAKEQLYDLHTHHRFFPINSARTIGLMLAIDPELRRTGQHRQKLIAMADRRLLAEPFNPPGSAFPLSRQLAHAMLVSPVGLADRIRRRLSRTRDGRPNDGQTSA